MFVTSLQLRPVCCTLCKICYVIYLYWCLKKNINWKRTVHVEIHSNPLLSSQLKYSYRNVPIRSTLPNRSAPPSESAHCHRIVAPPQNRSAGRFWYELHGITQTQDIFSLADTAWKHHEYPCFCILPLEFEVNIDIHKHENSEVIYSNRNKSPKEMSGNSRLQKHGKHVNRFHLTKCTG